MPKKFQSIFSSNEKIDQNLNALFTQHQDEGKNVNENVELDETGSVVSFQSNNDEQQPTSNEERDKKSTNKNNKKNKFDQEKEKRTVFVGNLQKDCKKEVFNVTRVFVLKIEKF